MWLIRDEGDFPMFPEEIRMARLGNLALWCAMPQCATLTAIEQRGFKLDVEWCRATTEENLETVTRLKKDLAERYGMSEKMSFAPTSKTFKEWAAKAVAADDLRVISTTAKGNPQWTKGILKKLARDGSEVAPKLLELRGAGKKAEYTTAWLKLVKGDGRIYANYNQGTVVTGRLSSSSPNMQQVTKSLKPAYIPDEGMVIIDLDYSQIELRIAAYVSQCQPMIEAYKAGRDLHAMMAAQIVNFRRRAEWAKWAELRKLTLPGAPQPALWINDLRALAQHDPEISSLLKEQEMPERFLIGPGEVTPEERQAGKAANFGLLYGMGAAGFRNYAEDAYGVFFTVEQAYQVHEAFFDLWQGLREWHIRMGAAAQRDEEVASPIGRVRRIPEINGANERAANGAIRVAINAPVQGFASDMMQIAAACIEGNMPKVPAVKGAQLLGTVHDSIFLQAPADQWERVAERCQSYMTKLVPKVLKKMGCDFDVPLAASAEVGTRYGLKDIAVLD